MIPPFVPACLPDSDSTQGETHHNEQLLMMMYLARKKKKRLIISDLG